MVECAGYKLGQQLFENISITNSTYNTFIASKATGFEEFYGKNIYIYNNNKFLDLSDIIVSGISHFALSDYKRKKFESIYAVSNIGMIFYFTFTMTTIITIDTWTDFEKSILLNATNMLFLNNLIVCLNYVKKMSTFTVFMGSAKIYFLVNVNNSYFIVYIFFKH